MLESEGQNDMDSAHRMLERLSTGPLASTDFARNLKAIGELDPTVQ